MLEVVQTQCKADLETVSQRLKITGDSLEAVHCRELLPSLMAQASLLSQPSCLYCISPYEQAIPLEALASCSHLVCCFVGLGPGLNKAIDTYFQQGDYLEGFLLDHLGNEILFNASNDMNALIAQRLYNLGMKHTCRFSPGEGEMGLKYQTFIMEALQKVGTVPAKLNDHFMLIPEKSILYVIGAGTEIANGSLKHDCDLCDRLTCYFRTTH